MSLRVVGRRPRGLQMSELNALPTHWDRGTRGLGGKCAHIRLVRSRAWAGVPPELEGALALRECPRSPSASEP